jgi:hypothetical protein
LYKQTGTSVIVDIDANSNYSNKIHRAEIGSWCIFISLIDSLLKGSRILKYKNNI